MIQIRIIEHNDWEGETFSYVLHVTPEIADEINQYFSDERFEGVWEVEINTSYTPEQVEMLNNHSQNDYMDYIGFYKIPEGGQINEDMFYKAAGLNKI